MTRKTAVRCGALIIGFLIGMALYAHEPTQKDYATILLDTAFTELAK